MKRLVILSVIATTAALLLPGQARSHDIYPADPAYAASPVVFTFPAVRYGRDVIRVRHIRSSRVAKHAHARRVYGARLVRRSVHVSRPSYRTRRLAYHYAYPPTGYDPLPYRFGPLSAAIIVRYTW